MIEINGIEYRTESQWNQKYRAILKRQREKGIWKEWYIDKKHTQGARFYREDQTRPYNKREHQSARKKQRDLVKTRRERLSCKCCGKYLGIYAKYELQCGLCEFCREEHTAWQWLSIAHMVPTKDAKAYARYPRCWNPLAGEWDVSDKVYYYYKHEQVCKVSDEKYECLKEKYIKLFGGWEMIDLENTEYNGKKMVVITEKVRKNCIIRIFLIIK